MDQLIEQMKAGIAWLEAVAAGREVVLPDPEVLYALIRALKLNVIADVQRDASAAIPDEVIVPLKNPHTLIAGSGTVLSKLSFKTPSFAQIKKIAALQEKKGSLATAGEALVMLTGDDLTTADVDQLKSIDVGRCSEALEPFLVLLPRKTPD